MSFVNQLINGLKAVQDIFEAIKTAEKARVTALKSEASRKFEACYASFRSIQDVVNHQSLAIGKEHSELHILVAEVAFNTEHYDIARKVVERFLQMSPQRDQFYCRAKLLLGLIINHECRHTNGVDSITQHQLAVAEVMVALDVAIEPKNIARYKFLLFNISVTFWRIVNQFLRTSRAAFFVKEIGRIVTALEEQNDPDKEWRIMYLSAAAVCCDDSKDCKSATDYVDKAIEHAESLLGKTLDEEAALTAEVNDSSAVVDEIMSAFRAIEEREELLHKPPKIDPDAPPPDPNASPEPIELPPLEGLAAQGYDIVKEQLDASQEKKAVSDAKLRKLVEVKLKQQEAVTRLYMQRVTVNPSDAKRFTALPNVTRFPRSAALVQIQAMYSNCVPDKEWEVTFQQIIKKLSEEPASAMRNETLLDVSRAAWRLQLRVQAEEAAEVAQQGHIVSRMLRLKQDICEAIKSLADIESESVNQSTGRRLSTKQMEGYFVSKRIEAVRVLERCVSVCMNIGTDHFLVQELCLTMWNAIIPLLQSHLRLKVHTSLKTMAVALEAVASPLVLLRMNVHFELSKCEEMADFVVMAKEEGTKAFLCDYGNLEKPNLAEREEKLDRNREMDHIVRPYVDLLELRSSVFDAPSEVEGQVRLWLQQATESNSKSFISDMITRSLFMMLETLQYADEEEDNAAGAGGSSSSSGSKAAAADGATSVSQTQAGATTTDFSLMLMQKGKLTIPDVELGDLEQVLEVPRSETKFSTYSALLHTRMQIMYDIARLAHAVQNVSCLQQAGSWLLRTIWDVNDPVMRGFIDIQIHVHYLIADNLLTKIQSLSIPDKPARKSSLFAAGTATAAALTTAAEGTTTGGGASDAASTAAAAAAAAVSQELLESLDPRCLGLNFPQVSEEIKMIKRLVLQFLTKGLQLALQVQDYYAVQNGVIYFWNLHMHVFRSNLYAHAMEEVFEFLCTAVAAIDEILLTPPANPAVTIFDPRLRISLLETLVAFYEYRQNLGEALQTAMKGALADADGGGGGGKSSKGGKGKDAAAAAGSAENTSAAAVLEYHRKRLCEAASRITLLQSAAGGGGGKGGKGGGAPGDPPVFGNGLLDVFARIVQAEQSSDIMPAEQSIALVDKSVTLMDTAVSEELAALPMVDYSQERFNQLLELQVEAWTRLTRLRMLSSDTIGAQYTAEKCLALISKDSGALTAAEEASVNPRVWRWVSVCERLFGNAIAAIIQPEGQDLALQNELRMAALSHFQLACDYALKAGREELVVEAGVNAWNCNIPLIDDANLRDRLFRLQRKIVAALLQCKSTPNRAAVDQLRQQFYLAIIEGYAQREDWDKVMKTVMEAFEYVSTERQKPLWQWRVIALSKKGKSVLDGMQKLKEGDPSLQAQVYGILARASSIPQQQLESYLKALEVLSESMERVDYILETAQWMGSTGIPQADIREMLKAALDALYEVEEQAIPEIAELDEDEAGEVLMQGGLQTLFGQGRNGSEALLLKNTTAAAEASSVGSGSVSLNNNKMKTPRSVAATPRRTGTEASRRASTAVHASNSKAQLGGGDDSGSVGGGSVAASSRRGPRSNAGGTSRAGGSRSRRGSGSQQSRRTGAKSKAGDQQQDEENMLPERLDFKMLEQATRTLVMLGMLESQLSIKRERAIEAAYFIRQALDLWMQQLQEMFKRKAFMELSPEEKEGTEDTPAVSYETFSPDIPDYLIPPEEPILLLQWAAKPSPERRELMKMALEKCPKDVPSAQSLPTISLTMHYLSELSETLHVVGYSKFALLTLTWMRMLLTSLAPMPNGSEAALAMIFFKSSDLLKTLGLNDVAHSLLPDLPVRDTAAADSAASSATTTATGGGKSATAAAATTSTTDNSAANSESDTIAISQYLQQFIRDAILTAASATAANDGNSGDPAGRSASVSAQSTIRENMPASEFRNPFGLSTFTLKLSISGGLDTHRYLLHVCDALLSLGHTSLCQSLARALLSEFTRRSDKRATLQCASILSKVDCFNGRYQDALAAILGRRGDLEEVGDASLLALHTKLLVQCYINAAKPEEASHVSGLAMDMLEDVAIQLIDKKAIQQERQQLQQLQATSSGGLASRSVLANTSGMTSMPPAPPPPSNVATAASNATIDRRRSSTAGGFEARRGSTASRASTAATKAPKMVMESSACNVIALVDIARSYIQATITLCKHPVDYGPTPLDRFNEMCSRLDCVFELVCDVVGPVTPLAADALTLRATVTTTFVSLVHTKLPTLIDMEVYQSWLAEQIDICITTMEKVTDMRRVIAQDIPIEDFSYTSSDIIAAAEASSKQGLSTVPYKELSIPAVRALANAQSLLAQMLLLKAVLKGDHTTHTDFNEPPELNTIEQYLEVTAPPRVFEKSDFEVPLLVRLTHIVRESCEILRGVHLTEGPQYMQMVSTVMQFCADGQFDCMWRPIPKQSGASTGADADAAGVSSTGSVNSHHSKTSKGSKGSKADPEIAVPAAPSTIGESALSVEAVNQRNNLIEKTHKLVSTKGCMLFDVSPAAASFAHAGASVALQWLPYACVALIEASGANSAPAAVGWILQLNSIMAAQWLRDAWLEQAINPVSATAGSIARLQTLLKEQGGYPFQEPVTQVQAELECLRNTNVPFRRLSVAAKPEEILKLCPRQTVVMCLQFCPLQQTLYLAIGLPKPLRSGGGTVTPPPDPNRNNAAAAGSWIVDRVKISEESRRELYTIKQQHSQWVSDVTKFIASSGENAPTDFDLEGVSTKYLSKNLRKAEHALEERLRALIDDLERIVEPLLGTNSAAQVYLRNIVLTAHQRRTATTAATGGVASIPAETATHSDVSILLLLDPTLQGLPWEGLEFADGFDGQIARDFSIHMWHHRMLSLYGTAFPAAGADDATVADAQTAAVTAAHGGAAPLSINPASVRYIVDPLNEDAGNRMQGYARNSLHEEMQALMTVTENGVIPATARLPEWKQVRSANGIVSTQDFLLAMDEATQRLHATATKSPMEEKVALFCYVLGKIGSFLPPVEVSNMNLEKMAFLGCVDMSNNDASNRRQISADVLKQARYVDGEMPLQMAALFSLAGTGSLLMHSWSTPVNAQNRFVRSFMRYFTNSATEFPAAPVGSKHSLLTAVALASHPLGSKSSTVTTTSVSGTTTTMAGTKSAVSAAAAAIVNSDGSTPAPSTTATATAAGESVANNGGPPAIKKWIRLARVVYGAHHITYN